MQTLTIEHLTNENFNTYLKQIKHIQSLKLSATAQNLLQIKLVAQINSLTIALLLAIKRANILYAIQMDTQNTEYYTELNALIELYGLQSLSLITIK